MDLCDGKLIDLHEGFIFAQFERDGLYPNSSGNMILSNLHTYITLSYDIRST